MFASRRSHHGNYRSLTSTLLCGVLVIGLGLAAPAAMGAGGGGGGGGGGGAGAVQAAALERVQAGARERVQAGARERVQAAVLERVQAAALAPAEAVGAPIASSTKRTSRPAFQVRSGIRRGTGASRDTAKFCLILNSPNTRSRSPRPSATKRRSTCSIRSRIPIRRARSITAAMRPASSGAQTRGSATI